MFDDLIKKEKPKKEDIKQKGKVKTVPKQKDNDDIFYAAGSTGWTMSGKWL